MYLSELWFSQGTRTEEPGRLQSMGSPSVRHNLATKQQQIPCSGTAGSYGSLRNLHTVLYSDLSIYIPPNSVDVVAVTKQQDGWDGGGVGEGSEMEGMYVYTQLVHFVLQQKLTRPCKAVIRQCVKLKDKRTSLPSRSPPPVCPPYQVRRDFLLLPPWPSYLLNFLSPDMDRKTSKFP